ncbi:MAG: FAD-dependent oxidoreductase [bacterium]
MIEFETEVLDIIQRTHDVKSFRFKLKENADFKAGQFFCLYINISGKEAAKYFSFSNSPTEKGYLEFTKRITGSEFSDALNKLKTGDVVRIKMPYGNFTFNGEYKKIAFLSGGIGITPIRSICKYAIDKQLDTDIVLLYGNRTAADIIFKEDFELMQQAHRLLKIVHVLSTAGEDWKGRRGHINYQIIKEKIPDYSERKFYICGPPAMVEAMKKILLEELTLSKENVITENFTGY